MTSAILTAIDPDCYTVLDFRALEALGLEDSDDVDFDVLWRMLRHGEKHATYPYSVRRRGLEMLTVE
jgi:hypothetical protein